MKHSREIVDQFTRQAEQFGRSPAARNEDILDRILRAARPGPGDTALDVASGPGVLVCALARTARHATGIDLTPAMRKQAKKNQQEQGLSNVSWDLGDAVSLPYGDAAFDVVTCRFAFHHFSDPQLVLQEMRRACRGGGRIVVADSAPAAPKAEAFNAMERMRDPSHVWAMPVEELRALFVSAGLPEPHVEQTRLALELDSWLARSYPREGDEARIRALFEQALVSDTMDVNPAREQGKVLFSIPVAILSAQVPYVL